MNQTEKKNHDKAIEHFKNIGIWEKGMVLHHMDPSLKTTDPGRYHNWNVEDVIPLTNQQHMRLHMRLRMKGVKKTAAQIEAMKAGHRKERRNCNVMIHRVVVKDGIEGVEALVFPSCSAAALHIGCSLQTVYQVASKTQKNRKAMGWSCNYVPTSVSPGKVAEDIVRTYVA